MSFAYTMDELSSRSDRTEQEFVDDSGAVVGIDEVGRGAMAGPLFAAGCRLEAQDYGTSLVDDIDDSKTLRVSQLRDLASELESRTDFVIAAVEPWTIDTYGLACGVRRLFSYIASQFSDAPVLVDGTAAPEDTLSVPGGDGRFKAIGAASILAKNARDAYMADLAVDYPPYGFEDNVGYGTGHHRKALDEHGSEVIHRASFGSDDIDEMPSDRRERAQKTLSDTGTDVAEDPPIYVIRRGTR